MTDNKDDEKFRYLIEARGTQVREYYEFDSHVSVEYVRDCWLDDVAAKYGEGFRAFFRDRVEVEDLCQKTTTSSSERQVEESEKQRLPETSPTPLPSPCEYEDYMGRNS